MFLAPIGPPVRANALALAFLGKATTRDGVKVWTTQGFYSGENCNPLTLEKCHKAWDLAMPTGTEVIANQSGTVVEAGPTGGNCGTTLVIEAGSGRRTRYCHLSQVLASVGMVVRKGDTVALSGSTGLSTGPHLHEQSCPGGSSCTLTDPRRTLQVSEALTWAAWLAAGLTVAYALTRM